MPTMSAGKRIELKRVLFLTDFSESSAAALPVAGMIARAYGAKVTALHVLVPSVYAYTTPEMSTDLLDAEEDLAKSEMRKVEAELAGLPCDCVIERSAEVSTVLSKLLEQTDAHLVVLGTHGRTGLNKAAFGSTAEEIFRKTTIPVLTIGPAVRTGIHNGGRFRCILFATDFNPISIGAASYAISLAQENESRLVLLHVLPTPKPGKANRLDDLSVAEALHRLGDLLPQDAKLRCRPEPVVEHGQPGEQILAAAERWRADLIVLGVRGTDTLTKLVTRVERATAYEVVSHAPCPVLTVRG